MTPVEDNPPASGDAGDGDDNQPDGMEAAPGTDPVIPVIGQVPATAGPDGQDPVAADPTAGESEPPSLAYPDLNPPWETAPRADPMPPGDGARMTLGQHLEELRVRLVIVGLSLGALFIAAFVCYDWLWQLLMLPLDQVSETMDKPVDELVSLVIDGPLEGLIYIVRLAFYAALIVGMPILLHQLWRFISPGLHDNERRAVVPIFAFGTLMFLLGVYVAYAYAVPLGLQFMLGFNQTLPGTVDLWTLDKYIGFVTMACLGFGVAFETPLVMMALARVGLLRPASILRHWRYAMMGTVVLGAVLTPPDPVTQLMLAGIMMGLYLLGWLLAVWVAPPVPDKQQA